MNFPPITPHFIILPATPQMSASAPRSTSRIVSSSPTALPPAVTEWLDDPQQQRIHQLHLVIHSQRKELDTVYKAWQDLADKLHDSIQEVTRLKDQLYSVETLDSDVEVMNPNDEPLRSVRRRLF